MRNEKETLEDFFKRLESEGLDNSSHLIMPTNEIATSIFEITGTEWSTHYPEVFRSVIEKLMRREKGYNNRVLSAFSHHYSKSFFIREIGENCKEFSDFEQNQAYIKGYNKAVKKLRCYFDEQEELVKESIKSAFTLQCN